MWCQVKQSSKLLFILFVLLTLAACGTQECGEGCDAASNGDGLIQKLVEPIGFEPASDIADTTDDALGQGLTTISDNVIEPDKKFESPKIDISSADTVAINLGDSLTLSLDAANTSAQKINWYYDFEPSDAAATNPPKVVFGTCNNAKECTFTATELSETVGFYTISVKGKNTSESTIETSGAMSTRFESISDEITVTVKAASSNDDSNDNSDNSDDNDNSDDDSDDGSSSGGFIELADLEAWTSSGTYTPVYFKHTVTSQNCQLSLSGSTVNGHIVDIYFYNEVTMTSSASGSCTNMTSNFDCDPIALNPDTYYISVTPGQGQGSAQLTGITMHCM